ncbi:MAG: bifunctional nicotinamidase/pyrazinamidase [Spirochaetales bacterium]|nr:bifunctional nicotinamidase/pyrazinamidase [Spirochaetales bacterium]
MKALIIIDIQNDFCPGGTLAVPDGDKVVEVINSLCGRFDKVIATRDWHPQKHVSFGSTHQRTTGEIIKLPSGEEQMLWPDHCVQGSKGADFHKNLAIKNFNIILHKGMNPDLDSYSAFYENDGKTSTGLTYYLNGFKIKEVFLCGLATDYCVYFTALDSLKEGFTTNLILDCCRAVNLPEGSEKKALKEMKDSGIKILNSSEI